METAVSAMTTTTSTMATTTTTDRCVSSNSTARALLIVGAHNNNNYYCVNDSALRREHLSRIGRCGSSPRQSFSRSNGSISGLLDEDKELGATSFLSRHVKTCVRATRGVPHQFELRTLSSKLARRTDAASNEPAAPTSPAFVCMFLLVVNFKRLLLTLLTNGEGKLEDWRVRGKQ